MLRLFNIKHNFVCLLRECKDIRIEKDLKTADCKLSFSFPVNHHFYHKLQEEAYIQTKENEYVIKEIHELDNWTEFTCIMNVEALEGKAWDRFESVEQTIKNALNLALVGTNWVVGKCDITKKRTVRKSNCSSWDIIQDIKKTYMVDIQFDCINKKINIYEHLGTDKGVYFMDSLNVKKLETQRDSYDFYTRIIPIGKDNLSIKNINNGKNYVENYQYSSKIKTLIWKDERYTVVENLKADAEAKLYELSKPRRAYKVDIINLAKENKKYSVLDYSLGDTITLISKDKNVREKQRIVKTTEYLLDHSLDSVEIANTVLTFEDIQQTLEDASDTVSNITCDNGTVDGSCIDSIETKQISDFQEQLNAGVIKATAGEFDYLKTNKADMQDLNAVKAQIGTLSATEANITHLKNDLAEINKAIIKKADIDSLNANIAKIKTLESDSIATKQLFSKYSTLENLNSFRTNILELVNQKATIGQAKIMQADIDYLKTNKADISTLNALQGNFKTINGDIAKFKSVFSDVLTSGKITANSSIIAEGAIGDEQVSHISANKIDSGTIDTSKIQIVGGKGRLRIVGDKLQVLDNKNNQLYERIMLGVDDKNNSALILRGADGKTVLLDQNGLSKAGFTDGYNKVQDNSLDASKFDFRSITRGINNGTETIKGTKVEINNNTLDIELSNQQNKIDTNSKNLYTQSTKIQALEDGIKLKVDEQIFNKTTTEINNNIADTTTKNKNYTDSKVTEVKTDFSKSMAEIKVVKDLISTKLSKEDIESIKKLGDTTVQKVNSLETKFTQTNNEFRKSISSLNSNIVTTQANVEQNKKDNDNKLSNLNGKIDDSNVKIANVKQQTATLETNLDKIKAELTTSITNVDNRADKKIKDTNTKIANLELDYNGLSGTIQNIKNSTVRDINSIKQTNNSNSTDIKALQKEVSFKINSDTVDKEINNITNDYNTKINNANSSIKELQDSIKLKIDSNKFEENKKTINNAITTAKQDAITTASQDATNKANNAVNNSNKYTDNKITVIDSKLDKSNTELNVLKNKIQGVVEDTSIQKIENIIDNKVVNVTKKINSNSNKIEATSKSLGIKIENVNSSISDLAKKTDVRVADIKATAEQLKMKFNNPKIKTGITTINADGIKVEHEDAGTETNMTSEGFVIKDKYRDRVIASFGTSDNGSMSKLCVDEITCNNVCTYFPWGNVELYVCHSGRGNKTGLNWNNASGSIQSALDYYRNGGVMLTDGQTITVNVEAGIYNMDVKLYGFTGSGAIKLSFNNNVVMHSTIYISNCTCSVILDGGSKYGGAVLTDMKKNPSIHIVRSNGVYVKNFRNRGGNTTFLHTEFSRVSVTGCDISLCNRICDVSTCSTVSMRDNRGSDNEYLGVVEDGGTLSVSLNAPVSNKKIGNNWGGMSNLNVNNYRPGEFFNVPGLGLKNISATFNVNSRRSWRSGDGDRYGFVFQGGNPQYGYWVGHCNINCQDWANKSTDKNSFSGRVWLQRKNTGHGINGKANICVCNSNASNSFGVIGSLNRGESGWFNLPHNAVQQIVNGGDLCFYNNNPNNYIQFENDIIVELTGQFEA